MSEAKIPARFADQPELVNAVTDARQLLIETGDDTAAIEWLLEI